MCRLIDRVMLQRASQCNDFDAVTTLACACLLSKWDIVSIHHIQGAIARLTRNELSIDSLDYYDQVVALNALSSLTNQQLDLHLKNNGLIRYLGIEDIELSRFCKFFPARIWRWILTLTGLSEEERRAYSFKIDM